MSKKKDGERVVDWSWLVSLCNCPFLPERPRFWIWRAGERAAAQAR